MEENTTTSATQTQQQDAQPGQQQQQMTMAEKLIALRQSWTAEITDINAMLKNLQSIDKLLNYIYMKRQNAVDLYYGTYGVYNTQIRNWKCSYAQIYNQLKTGQNNIRYTSDTAINVQIEAQLVSQKQTIDELKNFLDFMWETIKTIDNIIFGVNQKVKIYEIQNGLKY